MIKHARAKSRHALATDNIWFKSANIATKVTIFCYICIENTTAILDVNSLILCGCRCAKGCKSDRSRHELSNFLIFLYDIVPFSQFLSNEGSSFRRVSFSPTEMTVNTKNSILQSNRDDGEYKLHEMTEMHIGYIIGIQLQLNCYTVVMTIHDKLQSIYL